jgi:uncharacterized protein with HEPN domain
MPRDADVYLADILTAIGRVQGFTRGLDRVAFLGDTKTIDAVPHKSNEKLLEAIQMAWLDERGG